VGGIQWQPSHVGEGNKTMKQMHSGKVGRTSPR